ncbi:MAG: NAD(P)-binding domain-containing protein [Pseudomonadota bacterium]
MPTLAQSDTHADATQAAPIAVIGAGPVGLAAAAHLLARGLEPVILEQAEKPGAAVLDWGHVPMFSSWEFNVDRIARAMLEKTGWTMPDPDDYPTGRELTERYLAPLAALPDIASRLRLGTRVTGVARTRVGKVRSSGRADAAFELRIVDRHGWESSLRASAVIDATGTWTTPNPAGANGLPALGEEAASDRIHYGMPDVLGAERERYAGRSILVVGSGHSAVGTLIDLAVLAREEPETEILWARRRETETVFGGGEADQLPRRGALGETVRKLVADGTITVVAPFFIDAVSRAPDGGLLVSGDGADEDLVLSADEMIVATGLRPDLEFLREVRLDLDPALDCPRTLAPLIDPNIHSCGTVRPHGAVELAQPEPDLFILGMKSYGRAPTFLLATGYEQARSVAAWLAGDLEAAKRVELALPETGVCSGPGNTETDGGCCDPIPAEEMATADACCAQDADAKATGLDGCGCEPAKPAASGAGCCGARA